MRQLHSIMNRLDNEGAALIATHDVRIMAEVYFEEQQKLFYKVAYYRNQLLRLSKTAKTLKL